MPFLSPSLSSLVLLMTESCAFLPDWDHCNCSFCSTGPRERDGYPGNGVGRTSCPINKLFQQIADWEPWQVQLTVVRRLRLHPPCQIPMIPCLALWQVWMTNCNLFHIPYRRKGDWIHKTIVAILLLLRSGEHGRQYGRLVLLIISQAMTSSPYSWWQSNTSFWSFLKEWKKE